MLSTSERITDVSDELTSGHIADPLKTLDTSEPTPTETVSKDSGRSVTSVAKSAYYAISSVFRMFDAGMKQVTK